MLLHNTLYLEVDSRHDRIAVLRLLHRPRKGRVLIQITVFLPVRAVEDRIVRRFDPIASHIAVDREPDHITGKRIVRISSDIIILQPDSFDIGIILLIVIDLFEPLRRVIIDPFQKNTVPARRTLLHDAPYLLFLNTKTFRKHLYRGFDIFLLAAHDLDVQDHIVDSLAGCDLGAVAVHDISPFERNRPAVILLLVQYHLRIAGTAGRIDICNPAYQYSKS